MQDQVWSMDFVADKLVGGGKFRVLTVVDLYTRECLALSAGRSLRGGDVITVLSDLAGQGSHPQMISLDHGSEFASREIETWAYLHGVKLQFIRPEKPVEKCYIESFNGKFRDECLNANLFFTLSDVTQTLKRWKDDYNNFRPHNALLGMPRRAFRQHKQRDPLTHFL